MPNHAVAATLTDRFVDNVPGFVLGFVATGIGGIIAFHTNFTKLETKFEEQRIYTEKALTRIEQSQDDTNKKLDSAIILMLERKK